MNKTGILQEKKEKIIFNGKDKGEDREAWHAEVHGVAERTQLSD